MMRYKSHVKANDLDTNDAELEINPRSSPCGGMKRGYVHFDAEPNSKIFVAWKTLHPDVNGNCTIRIGAGLQQSDFTTLKPVV